MDIYSLSLIYPCETLGASNEQPGGLRVKLDLILEFFVDQIITFRLTWKQPVEFIEVLHANARLFFGSIWCSIDVRNL